MFPIKIANVIYIKVPLTLNFKILYVQTFSLFLLVTYYVHKNDMYSRYSACFSRRRHFAIQDAVLVSEKRKILRDYQRKSNETFTVWCH